MGYVHYYPRKRDIGVRTWTKISKDVDELLEASPVELTGPAGERGTDPVVGPERIAFNGVEENAHEDFTLWRTECPNDGGFCKTDRHPYDFMVKATLIVVYNRVPTSRHVYSDGHDFEWEDAEAWVNEILGTEYVLPKPVEDGVLFHDWVRPGTDWHAKAKQAYLAEEWMPRLYKPEMQGITTR